MNKLIALCLAAVFLAPTAAMAHGGDEHEENPALEEPSVEMEQAAGSTRSEFSEDHAGKTVEEIKANKMRLAHEAVVSLKYRATFAVVIIFMLMALLAYKYPSLRSA